MTLTASQRVTLIKEVARRLGTEEWPFIDVTLKQFSLPWSDQWRGEKDAYVIQMIENAQDETLVELAHHVGFHLDEALPRVDPPFWRRGMLKLFISHLSTHRDLGAELQERLLNYGISGFVAHNDIEPTLEWQAEIEAALSTCDALVALLHPKFHQSNWTDQEIGFAMGRGVPVLAVRLGQDPYGFISRFQAFKGEAKEASDLATELFEALRKHKQTQRRMGKVLVGLFEASGSFAEAKSLMGHLEELQSWDPSFSMRIRAASKVNSQIVGAWGVSERAAALVKRWATSGV